MKIDKHARVRSDDGKYLGDVVPNKDGCFVFHPVKSDDPPFYFTADELCEIVKVIKDLDATNLQVRV